MKIGSAAFDTPAPMIGIKSIPFLLAALVCAPLDSTLAQNDPAATLIVENDVLIETRDGTPVAAIVVRHGASTAPQPTALLFSIYRTDNDVQIARYAARWGFASVVAYARGVRTGVTKIVPYEHDAEDIYDVIGWVSRQPWSDGQVGMYGGSYSGFAQWAVARFGATKLTSRRLKAAGSCSF